MPTTNQKVHFRSCTAAQYTAATKDDNSVYFLSDTFEIYVGANKYSGGSSGQDKFSTISDSAYSGGVNRTLVSDTAILQIKAPTAVSIGNTTTGAALTVDASGTVLSDLTAYSRTPTLSNDLQIPTKKYVDDTASSASLVWESA